jgi:23S rRNA (cytidine1920-2'-O)/16S rRNA (cytidine1409-2'-O)-methyltransferase
LTSLPEPVDLATVDVSFISLKLILPAAKRLLRPCGQIIALIKPQFEAGRQQVRKGGVVKDPAVHRSVLYDVLTWAVEYGLWVRGVIASPLLGPAGNVEFLSHLTVSPGQHPVAPDELIEQCLATLYPEQK